MSGPFYDKHAPTHRMNSGFLPHWHQNGKLQFITFRLADSLPQSKLAELRSERELFLTNNPKPWDSETQRKFNKLHGPAEEKLLNRGYGECILRNPDVRSIVVEALHHGDGSDYTLIAFVVMPNHVHALMLITGEKDINTIMQGIKSFTTNTINHILGSHGPVWMHEYFDHLVRSQLQFNRLVRYIASNPARLTPGNYEVYITKEIDW